MEKIVLAVTISLLATGCATVQKVPLGAESSAALKNQTVVQTTRSKPDFVAMTAGKATFAMLGALAAISEGNDIVKTNNVADPASEISTTLAQDLQASRNVQLISPAVFVDSAEPEKIAAAANGKARYVLDVETAGWMFSYFLTDFTHYRVSHTAHARLIDTETKKIIAQGTCRRTPESNVNAPTYDDLIDNQALILKKELKIATDECVKTLKTEMLAI